MGNCVSSKTMEATAAKVIHMDGTMEEYFGAIRAGQVAAKSPWCYVCSIETMAIGAEAVGMLDSEELEPGQLYFLMPLSKSRHALSLHDLCQLAVTASMALGGAD